MTATPLALLPSYSLEKWKVNELALRASRCAGFALFETPTFPPLCLMNINLCLLEIPKRKTLITHNNNNNNKILGFCLFLARGLKEYHHSKEGMTPGGQGSRWPCISISDKNQRTVGLSLLPPSYLVQVPSP